MKILNLVYPDKSDIKYKKIQFPDGQQSIVLDMKIKTDKAVIKTRLNNFKDVELLICATQALYNTNSVKEIALYCPYFLGSRSDRKFEYGSVNYLKDVICPIINSLNFFEVSVLDPHSDVLEACLNNFRKESNLKLVEFVLSHLKYIPDELENWQQMSDLYTKNGYILVSPDAGATKKIYKLAEQIGYTGDIIICSKERDKDGRLTQVNVPLEHKHLRKDYIIIDDICDGGRTFINIAKELKTYMQNDPHAGKIYLIVTHGIFSKGFEELSKYFDGIYCTNSYSDIEPPINFTERHHYIKEKVKQLNVY